MTSIPPTPVPQSKLNSILSLINIALQGLSLLPIVGGPASLADLFLNILQHGLTLYQQESGQPLDLTKIPQEALLP
jgi:hypothetical protein